VEESGAHYNKNNEKSIIPALEWSITRILVHFLVTDVFFT
jgi:hypothetical protein